MSSGRFAWPVRRRTPAGPEGTAEDIAVQDVAEREAADRRLPPPAPEPILDPPPRFNLAMFRLAALGLALVLTLALTLVRLFVGGPPSVAELRAQAGVDTWPELSIGVKDDQYGTAFYDESTKIWSGFDIDIAYMIAEDLGFRRDEVKFYGLESEDRARMQATDEAGKRVPVKMVIASFSITEERKKMAGVRFSAPYLYTEQSALTLKGAFPKISTMADLRDRRVCSLSSSTSATALDKVKAVVLSRNRIRECIRDLRDRNVDAISTDAAILAGYKDRFPDEFDHWDLGLDPTEAWGVNVGENPALEKLVDLTLYRSFKDPKDTRWERAFQENLQVETETNREIPIAVAQQPRVDKPDVRELPWEDVFG